MQIEELKRKMDEQSYVYDDTLATVLAVALQLGRPLLIEGAAGVGKTEIAKVMAAALDRDLVRLQCYEGLDESKALYEWNYQKQLLSIQVNMGNADSDSLTRSFKTFFPRSAYMNAKLYAIFCSAVQMVFSMSLIFLHLRVMVCTSFR